MRVPFWRLFPLFTFLILILFLWRGLFLNPTHVPSTHVGKKLPDFQLPRLDNPYENVMTSDLKGQVSLLNFWASWCSSCTQEQLFLGQLAKKGIPIYGINYKDDTHRAIQWLRDWGNPYLLIGEDKEGKLAIDLGVYGTPETFLIDKNGLILFRHVGIMDESSWQREFLPRMHQSQGKKQ